MFSFMYFSPFSRWIFSGLRSVVPPLGGGSRRGFRSRPTLADPLGLAARSGVGDGGDPRIVVDWSGGRRILPAVNWEIMGVIPRGGVELRGVFMGVTLPLAGSG